MTRRAEGYPGAPRRETYETLDGAARRSGRTAPCGDERRQPTTSLYEPFGWIWKM